MMRLAILAALCAAPSPTFAITWEMARPDIASVAKGADAGPVLRALDAPEYKFVFGMNSQGRHVHFAYSGDTAALNAFLRRLAACDGVELRLRLFKTKGEAPEHLGKDLKKVPCQWLVNQDLSEHPGVYEVSVFLGDGRIDLEKLELPSWRGPACNEKVTR
jgi:hypothetical protein